MGQNKRRYAKCAVALLQAQQKGRVEKWQKCRANRGRRPYCSFRYPRSQVLASHNSSTCA